MTHRERSRKLSGDGWINPLAPVHLRDMHDQHLLDAPPVRVTPPMNTPVTASAVMTSTIFGHPVRGRVLLAVADRWAGELLEMLPWAERHEGDVHFAPTAHGPGLRPCSMGLLVVDPEVARLESLRPALARGGALAVVGPDGTLRWTRDAGAPRAIGRLQGQGR